MIKIVVLTVVFLAGLVVMLFASAGRLDWPMGWAYLGILAAVTVVIVACGDRDMLRLRAGRELEGYSQYAKRTKYRLCPGLW